jgi:predicted nuclease with TOPRIM domain
MKSQQEVIFALHEKRNELLRENTALENRIAELEAELANQQECAVSLADDYVKTVEEIKANFAKQLANSVPFDVFKKNCHKPHDGTCKISLEFRNRKNCPLIPKGE